MRKLYFLLTLLNAFLFVNQSDAQCARSNFFWGQVDPGCGANNSATLGTNEYIRTPFRAGVTYIISTCGTSYDTQITGYQATNTAPGTQAFYNDNNGPDCGGLTASVQYTSTFTDFCQIQFSRYNCSGYQGGGGLNSGILIVREVPLNSSISSGSVYLCPGNHPTLSVDSPNTSGAYTYYWQTTPGGTSTANAGTTFQPSTPGTYYVRARRNSYTNFSPVCWGPASNGIVVLSATNSSTGTASANPPTICTGGTSTLSVSGFTRGTNATPLWYSGGSCAGAPIDSGTTLTVSPGTTQTYSVRFVGECNTSACQSVTVNVNPDPAVSISGGTTICSGGSLILTSSVTNGVGPFTYVWESGPSNTGPWIPAGSSANISTGPLTSTTWFRLTVSSSVSGCNTVTSNTLQVPVVADPTISASGTTTICSGGSATLNSATTGGTGSCSYQWQIASSSGGPFTDIIGQTSSSLNTGALVATRYYRLVRSCTGNGCNQAISNTVTITVVNDPIAVITTPVQTICTNGSFTLNTSVSNGIAPFSFDWQVGPSSSGPWTSLGAPDTNVYTNTLLSPGVNWYGVVVSSPGVGCNTANSNSVSVTVNNQPSVTAGSATTTICTGGTAVIVASPSGGAGADVFQWQSASSLAGPWTNVGSNTSNYNAVSLTATTHYRVIYTTTGSGCDPDTSNSVTITVNPDPALSISSNFNEICITGSVQWTGATTGGAGVCTVSWDYSTNSPAGPWISVGTGGIISHTPGTTGTYYYRGQLNCTGNGCNPDTKVDSVIVSGSPAVSVLLPTDTSCAGDSMPISALYTGGTSLRQFDWFQTGVSPVVPVTQIGNNLVDTFINATAAIGAHQWTVNVIDPAPGCGGGVGGASSTAEYFAPPIPSLPTADTASLCVGAQAIFTPSYTGGFSQLDVSWEVAAIPAPYTDSGVHEPTFSLAETPGIYDVRYSVGNSNYYCNPVTSSKTSVTFFDQPQVVLPFTDSNTCENEQIIVDANNGGFGPEQWQWEERNGTVGPWTTVKPFDANPGADIDTVFAAENIDQQHRVILRHLGKGCVDDTAGPITINRDLIPSAVTTSLDVLGCYDDVMTPIGSNPAEGYPRWRFYGPGTAIYQSFDSSYVAPSVKFTQSGTYQAVWLNQSQRNACPSTADTTEIRWNDPFDISLVNGAVGVCISTGFDTWVRIADAAGNLIAAVDDNNENLGNVSVTQYVEPSGKVNGNAYLGRHWVINTDNAPSNPVGVRLYFTDGELLELINNSLTTDPNAPYASLAAAAAARIGGASDANGSTDDDDIYNIDMARVTKYSGPDEDNVYGGTGGIYTLLNTINNGIGNTTYGSNYVEVQVSGFSEFWIHGTENNAALPVELLYLDANGVDNSLIQVSWATAIEINNAGFEIQRSEDGILFETIGWVDGNGNTTETQTYSFDDTDVQAGVTYFYRLRQVDFNDEFEFSHMVSARLEDVSLFEVGNMISNPAKDKTHLQISVSDEMEVSFSVFDNIGNLVQSGNQSLKGGNNLLEFDLSELSNGMYILRLETFEGVISRSFVVAK